MERRMTIYESQVERNQHEHAIGALAEELHRDISEVQSVYESAYRDLRSQARVKDYLPLLVTRRARALLRKRVA